MLSLSVRSELKTKLLEGERVLLKGWQQAAVTLGALMDPRRADLIAALGETTGKPAFQQVLQWIKNSSEGREVLLECPRVVSAQVSHAWDLPESTFGSAYAQFMASRNFSPDDRLAVRFMDTDELAYVTTCAREVHDFWQVLYLAFLQT
ncbi:hypothetical protein B296_00038898 [Ensete ventricosum]|uniref:Uncharacterized protein n=2 Tax=Ensete ventricosum TaxID=4639 RepID=A0A426ZBI0_ENSVE|nr:hypothetical protein B296_00038898 [Ensete ventricosum]